VVLVCKMQYHGDKCTKRERMEDTVTIDIKEYSYKALLALAQNPRTSSEVLNKLAKDKKNDGTIKTFVARHPNTSSKTLVYLLKYDEVEMMGAIAQHANTSAEILELMVRSSDKLYTQYKLAQNPNTPPEALEELADETDSAEVKLALSQNPSTPQVSLKQFFDETTLISIEARKNYDYQEARGL